MDYGQTNQQEGNQPFFTEGIGSQSVEYTDNPENDINLSNNATSWGNATPTRGQNQNFGHNAINGQLVENPNTQPVNLEVYASAPEMPGPDFGPQPEELGQITETEPASTQKETDEAPSNYSFDKTAIRIDGDKLSGKAVSIISDMEKTLSKTDDVAGFVDSFSDAVISNLDNSYNRKFGES